MKYGKWVVAAMFLVLLGLEVIRETQRREEAASGQGGGGVECLCATTTPQMVISPTPTDGSTVQPSASPTPLPLSSATPLPVPTGTLPALDSCWHPTAAYVKGWNYRYLDTRNTGLRQNLRAGPGTTYRIVGSLYKNQPRQIWYTSEGWVALDEACTQWALTQLGEFVAISTE